MEFAGMAKNQTLPTRITISTKSRNSEVLIVDNGATTTLSNSLFDMSNVQQCSVKISLAGPIIAANAGKEMSFKATHSGYKSYSSRM